MQEEMSVYAQVSMIRVVDGAVQQRREWGWDDEARALIAGFHGYHVDDETDVPWECYLVAMPWLVESRAHHSALEPVCDVVYEQRLAVLVDRCERARADA